MSTTAHFEPSWADLPYLDFTDPQFAWDSPAVAEAREKSWVARTPLALLVLRYAEADQLARDKRLISGFRGLVETVGTPEGPVRDFMVDFLQSLDGADHRRLRGLATHPFTPRRITEVRPFVRSTVEELAAKLPSGEFDFVQHFAHPLPALVMCQLLGFPLDDYDAVGRLSMETNLGLALSNDRDVLAKVEQGLGRMFDYLVAAIEKRKADPGTDLTSDIVRAFHDGVLDDYELRTLVATVLVAGYETTLHQLALAMVDFAQHPDQWMLLRENPELAPQAVEEVLRWSPTLPVTATRIAAQDFEVNGVRIPNGTPVFMCAHAAQRDPRVFADADTFDITVKREAPAIAFGGGPHFCLGTALAKVELAEALAVLPSLLDPPRITGEITWRHELGVAGPDVLPLRFGA
ncbi:cytochrome P450 [Streptomyces sp. AV19]|uniref:cytochrome P450 n=1 Tax=Streptomyces sp. AV19 TaxID=2793068 RepID=UPI0018FE7051|nr:cytochrome P450 [Streptomyces sp. AV19]MBH1938886.1 cytochrome P450 [Streptomyces sp. AV19]MDG4533495.1 cytochrome P450 [Streptomyces sp. AV19]